MPLFLGSRWGISPEITKFERSLTDELKQLRTNLESIQSEARTNGAMLEQASTIYSLILKAQAGDREAFFKLFKIGSDPNNPFQEIARRSDQVICDSVTYHTALYKVLPLNINPWVGTTNTSDTASLKDYIDRFNSPLARPDQIELLRQLYSQTRFSLLDRLNVLARMISITQDLTMLDQACDLMNQEAKIGKNFMAADEYLAWFEKRQKEETEHKADEKK